MKLEVRFFATFRKKHKNIEIIEVEKNATIENLLDKLDIDKETTIVIVNGKSQLLDYRLKDNDRIGLFPPVGGG